MKSIIVVVLSLMSYSLVAQSDAISTYFEKYLEDERFSSIYISPKMFNLIAKLDLEVLEEDDEAIILDVLGDLMGLRLLSTEIDPVKFYEEAVSTIDVENYDLLMSVRDEGENVRFWMKENGELINELLLMVGEEDEFLLVSFVGDIDLNKISRLAKVIEIDGVRHLNKLDDDRDDWPRRKQKKKLKEKSKKKEKKRSQEF
ncbi:MAG: DUF4252 domain-containing protein [Bacteroidota bacterium]